MGFLISGLYFGFIKGLGGKDNKNDIGRNFDKPRGLFRDYSIKADQKELQEWDQETRGVLRSLYSSQSLTRRE